MRKYQACLSVIQHPRCEPREGLPAEQPCVCLHWMPARSTQMLRLSGATPKATPKAFLGISDTATDKSGLAVLVRIPALQSDLLNSHGGESGLYTQEPGLSDSIAPEESSFDSRHACDVWCFSNAACYVPQDFDHSLLQHCLSGTLQCDRPYPSTGNLDFWWELTCSLMGAISLFGRPHHGSSPATS